MLCRNEVILKRRREESREVTNYWVCLLISFFACMLTACGDSEADHRRSAESVWHEDGLTWEALDVDPQAPGEPAARKESNVGHKQDEDLQQYLRQVTVQIQGSRYLGSGVIWDASEDTLVIATAAHVTQDNSPVTVRFGQGELAEAYLTHFSEQVDVAFLEVSLKEVEAQEIVWQVARQNQEICERLEAGQPLWIMGSIEEAADRAYGGSVVEPWIYIEDFDNYMLLGHAYAIPGVSGGGVFTQEGILVGILCGGNETDQVAVLPWSVMEANRE